MNSMKGKLIFIFTLVILFTISAFSQNDTISNKYILISADYYMEDVFMSRNFEFFDYPLYGNYGGVINVGYFYKEYKSSTDFLSFDIGYSRHQQQYYKLFTSLQYGSRFNIKYGFFVDALAGLSFHNSWTTNLLVNNVANNEIEKELKWGEQKLYFLGSFAIGKKLKKPNIAILLKTDFYVSYPFAFDNYVNAVRFGISYDISNISKKIK